jgi:deazaflavin-dependent oxidoreductase (nitroreductase family)
MINENSVINIVSENIDLSPNELNSTLDGIQAYQWIPYPTGVVRWLMRMPLLAYRLGLGNVLSAAHVLILTTRGHKTGRARHTPIEYRKHGKKVYLVSGWGGRPHWYQNVLAEPRVTVQFGGKTFEALGRQVTDNAEALRALSLFRRVAPARYDAVLGRLIESDVSGKTLPDYSSQFTIMRLDLTSETPSLPGVPVNLSWLLPIGLFAAFGGAILFVVTRLRRSA